MLHKFDYAYDMVLCRILWRIYEGIGIKSTLATGKEIKWYHLGYFLVRNIPILSQNHITSNMFPCHVIRRHASGNG